MPRGEYLGEFEQMVLLAVARLEGEAYGIAILEEIATTTGTEAAVASVHHSHQLGAGQAVTIVLAIRGVCHPGLGILK